MHNLDDINKLEVSIDWLGFTVFDFSGPMDVVTWLGFNESDFSLCNGGYGYKASLRHNLYSIVIFYDGNENMGIHIDISGSAVSPAVDSYIDSCKEPTPFGGYAVEYQEEGYMMAYLRYLNECAKFTRLDLAIDDKGGNYYSVDDVKEICENGRCASRFKGYRMVSESKFSSKGKTGNTLYIGDRSSSCYLRVYDKRLEQIKKLGEDVGFPWTRWELELKKERAQKAVDILLSGSGLGSVAVGVLSNYFRVIVRDDSNVSRCSTDSVWQAFISGVDKLRLSMRKVVKTLEEKKEWIKRQCAPSIAAVCASEGGDLGFILDDMRDALFRNSKAVLDMVFMKNPELRKGVFG